VPAYQRSGDSDVPEPVTGPQPGRKRGGRKMKAEPSTADPSAYATSLAHDAAMAASAIIGPPGAHDVHGQAGLGTGVSN
jgi:hypothetical protein